MDFHHVPPVDVKVRDLSLSIEPSQPILEALHLKRARLLENKTILQNVSLDIPAGSLMAIVGASGSGKVSRNRDDPDY
jgi:ABC-type multidrug transport system fused ATPase/permease subunit